MRIAETMLDDVIEGRISPNETGVMRLALDLREALDKLNTFARDLDNLRGDAETAGQEFNLWLSAFKFNQHHDKFIDLDYEPRARTKRGPMNDEDLENIRLTLRGMGWKAEIGECDDGINRVFVELKG